jgi:hypothetical protein
MKPATLKTAVGLAEKLKYALIATANLKGLPHVAVARKVGLISDDEIMVRDWFCPGTVTNVLENKHVSVVIWDAASDKGYQLLGEAEKVEDLSMLNGNAPDVEDQPPLPQVEKRLLIKVAKILEFKQALHGDIGN